MQNNIVNLELGMPTVENAKSKLDQALRSARARRLPWVKIIHGYGSSGKGGAIKREVHRALAAKLTRGEIQGFVPGEDFSPFHAGARAAADRCPELLRDRDYARGNDGVTIVVLLRS